MAEASELRYQPGGPGRCGGASAEWGKSFSMAGETAQGWPHAAEGEPQGSLGLPEGNLRSDDLLYTNTVMVQSNRHLL